MGRAALNFNIPDAAEAPRLATIPIFETVLVLLGVKGQSLHWRNFCFFLENTISSGKESFDFSGKVFIV